MIEHFPDACLRVTKETLEWIQAHPTGLGMDSHTAPNLCTLIALGELIRIYKKERLNVLMYHAVDHQLLLGITHKTLHLKDSLGQDYLEYIEPRQYTILPIEVPFVFCNKIKGVEEKVRKRMKLERSLSSKVIAISPERIIQEITYEPTSRPRT